MPQRPPTRPARAPLPPQRHTVALLFVPRAAARLASAWAPAFALAAAGAPAWAQTAPAAPAPPAAAAAPASSASAPRRAPPPAAPASASDGQRVEITGTRGSDTEQRRQATAAKIVIGREEIDKFGDATVGEVLRRLPGVTTPGAPGRGGPPRMRGLGNGFTQLLIDGQRIPPGFSLESLTPDQIERIEILRAPTAETGSRAIAGTINIITREGFRRRLNDVRVGVGVENGHASPGASWTHNDSAGNLIYNLSASAFKPNRESSSSTRTLVTDAATGQALEDRSTRTITTEHRNGLNMTGRLQWRLNEQNDTLVLMPLIFHGSGRSHADFSMKQALSRPETPRFYDTGISDTDNDFTNLRLNGQWRQRVGPVRLEVNGGGGQWRSSSHTFRSEYALGLADPIRTLQDDAQSRERTLNLTFKGSGLAGGTEEGGEHNLVAGGEVEASRRNDTRISLQDNQRVDGDFGDDLQASSLRLAAYAQDEWRLTPHWAAHAGLRWEGITTRGDTGQGERPTNRSSVWTPLLHAVYKPDPKGRDQLRISLTRSYRSPQLSQLIAKPTFARDYPLDGPNRETSPDSAGNPNLKPELATGVDIAIERYLEGGGILSANLFHRNITNLMRSVTTREAVPYSNFERFVRRPQNIGDASTTGIELEAKFRLDQLVTGAFPVELRSNLSVYDSKVKSVPGPNNRLDQQSRATANLGADYRLRSLPLTLGGNVNWVPGYTTRLDVDQFVIVTRKTVWDAYALWTFNPQTALRLLGNNLDPRHYASTTLNDTVVPTGTERTLVRSQQASYVNWQLRLELKL